MAGQRIIDGLNDAIAFMNGDLTRGRVIQPMGDGRMIDVTAKFMRERGHQIAKPRIITSTPREAAAEPERKPSLSL